MQKLNQKPKIKNTEIIIMDTSAAKLNGRARCSMLMHSQSLQRLIPMDAGARAPLQININTWGKIKRMHAVPKSMCIRVIVGANVAN